MSSSTYRAASPGRLLARTALGLVLACPALEAFAQSSAPVQLPPVSVEGQRPIGERSYQPQQSSSPKYTEPLLDTPQTITIVPEALIKDQGATTLREALRYVPGVSMVAGEGGGPQGDALRIRGFVANTDIYVDGMRDIAQYSRDPFNIEQIEVVKGPSSAYSGRGSTGGSVNLVTKTPRLGAFYGGDVTGGTDETRRVTVDVNQPIAIGIPGTAFRINAMMHDSEFAGRDVIENERWGLAPSLALGLGTPTRFNVAYQHFESEGIPDYGLPTINGRVAPVRKENFYGFRSLNTEETDNDSITAEIEHDLTSWLTIRDQVRYQRDLRFSIVSPPRNPNIAANTVTRNPTGRDNETTFAINQLDGTAKFQTGFVEHTLVAGVEISRERVENTPITFANAPIDRLFNPNPDAAFTGTRTRGALTESEGDNFAIYAFDTLKFGPQWEFVGGLRYDDYDFDTTNQATGVTISQNTSEPSWRAALIYKPIPNASVYVSYGNSFNPSAEALGLTAATANVDPEENESYEIGVKWDVFGEKLSLTAALFRTDKTNARETDANTGVTDLFGEQRAQGLELGAAGNITDKWAVFAGYVYTDSEVLETVAAGIPDGAELPNAPKHTVTLWTTYELPWRLQVGGGFTYNSERFLNANNTTKDGSYALFDALIAYHVTDNVDIRLNILNIGDEFYIERAHAGGAHAVPGAGRTALLSTSVRF